MASALVPFGKLGTADLRIDAIYEGGTAGTAADDPLARLLPGGNQGGFRYKKSPSGGFLFLILYTDLADPDWPDHLDLDLGRFTYYGDNKRPGHTLHDTPRGGNRALRGIFEAVHASPPQRNVVPPIFVFSKTRPGRRVVFRGLAVPGARDVSAADDLVAIWRTADGQRFQNYRAIFTILDAAVASRDWLNQSPPPTSAARRTPKSATTSTRSSSSQPPTSSPSSRSTALPTRTRPLPGSRKSSRRRNRTMCAGTAK